MERRTMTARGWLVVVLLALASFVSVPSASAAAEASTDTIVVETGGSVVVRITGYRNNESVVTWASSARGTVYATESGSVNNDGDGTVTVNIKRFWEPGWWAITVRGERSERRAVVTFKVRTGAPDGAVELSATTVAPGTTLQARGAGFRDTELVSAWISRPDGTADKVVASPLRPSNGMVTFRYVVPADAPTGVWAVTAYGNDSDRMLVAQFTVAR